MINFHKNDIKKVLVISFFAFIIFYGYTESRGLIDGVKIKISGLSDGASYKDNVIQISGMALRAKELLINGSPTFTEVNGNFNADLVLQNGYNVITVTAIDKFDKKSEEVYKVWGNVENVSTAMLNTDTNIIN